MGWWCGNMWHGLFDLGTSMNEALHEKHCQCSACQSRLPEPCNNCKQFTTKICRLCSEAVCERCTDADLGLCPMCYEVVAWTV